MQHFGDEGAGFSVDFDLLTTTVGVRAWGFWGADVAAAFGPAVRDACRDKPPGTLLLLNMTELKPMREEGQLSFGALLAQLPELGIAGLRIRTGSQLMKLQVMRLSSEHDKARLVQFE